MPVAIDFVTLAGISPRTDGKIVLYSENYAQERTFDAAAPPTAASKHWTDYPLGWLQSWPVKPQDSRLQPEPMGRRASGFRPLSSAALEVATALAMLSLIGVSYPGRCWRGFASGSRMSLWAPTAASWTSLSPPTARRTTPCCWIAATSASVLRRSPPTWRWSSPTPWSSTPSPGRLSHAPARVRGGLRHH